MHRQAFDKIVSLASERENQEKTLQYLTQHLAAFLTRGERVLICFHEHREGDLSWLMQQAVLRCGAVPVVWLPDRKWKTLLRQAFLNKASVIIGEPLLILGLTKLMKNYATPLYIRRVITAGYPCLQWMIDGIVKGFDCVVGGCYSLGITGVVAGFACGRSWGVHIREDVYGVDIQDRDGNPVPPGEMGEVVLYPKAAPELRLPTSEFARYVDQICVCGCAAPRLVDFGPGDEFEPDIIALGQELQSWTSILDCHVAREECGLVIDLVVFPGEKLPKLPSAARLNIRELDLETQTPFWYDPSLSNPAIRY